LDWDFWFGARDSAAQRPHFALQYEPPQVNVLRPSSACVACGTTGSADLNGDLNADLNATWTPIWMLLKPDDFI
jgi:hypothetical protein